MVTMPTTTTSEPAALKAGPLIGRLWRSFGQTHLPAILRLAPVLALVALTGTAYGFIVREIVLKLEARDTSVLVFAPIAILLAAGLRAGAMWAQAVMTQDLGQRILRDLQNAMFSSLMAADFARLQAEPPGGLVTRFTADINVIAEGLVRGLQVALRDALAVLGALIGILYIDWVFGALVLGVFALAAGPLSAVAKRARRQTERTQVQLGELAGRLTESLSSPRFIKTFQLEQQEIARAAAAFEERRRMQMKLAYNRARSDPLMEILGATALAGVLTLASWRIVAGAISIADLLAIITFIGAASPAARAIGSFNTVLNEAVAALGRVFRLLDEKPTIVDRPDAVPLHLAGGRVVFEAVGCTYGGRPALTDVSFTAEPGQTIALVGSSGAGKSSVLNLIPRLYDVSAGRVLIDGQDVRAVTLASLRANVAVVSQDISLFAGTIAENIRYGRPGASDAEVRAAAEAAAAHSFVVAKDGGYERRIGMGGEGLAGGERQRIALARAFLKDAPILLLDEATSALDADTEAQVQDALVRLARGRTTLVVAHRLSTIRDADQILVLDQGRIVERGSHAELTARGGIYARLKALQTAEAAPGGLATG